MTDLGITENVMDQLVHRISLSCVLSAIGLAAVAAESWCGEFSGLRFARSGIVRRDMVFCSFPQPWPIEETMENGFVLRVQEADGTACPVSLPTSGCASP